MSKRNPTIDDVAALSGVARTTVSRVLNGGQNVRPAMQKRVFDAIEQLGYKVNVQARNLASGGCRQIVLIHASDLETEPNSYYYSGLELGALKACADHGYQLITQAVNDQAPDWQRQIMAIVTGGRCDGIVLPPPFSDQLQLVEQILDTDCQLVCISAGEEVRKVASSVGIDDESAGYDIARHMISLGHRDFAYIKGLEGHLSAEGRFAGFLRALADGGISARQLVTERGNFTFRSGIECTERILTSARHPTALVCANDDMAAGALLACHKNGLAIPGDISVVGFDDTPVSDIIWPPLTTVHQPIKEIGRRAVDLLVTFIDEAGRETVPVSEFIPYRIVERQSAARL